MSYLTKEESDELYRKYMEELKKKDWKKEREEAEKEIYKTYIELQKKAEYFKELKEKYPDLPNWELRGMISMYMANKKKKKVKINKDKEIKESKGCPKDEVESYKEDNKKNTFQRPRVKGLNVEPRKKKAQAK